MKKQIAIFFVICATLFASAQSNVSPIPQMAIPPNALPTPSAQSEQQPAPPPDPEKFAALFPKIEGSTDKIGIPFWKKHWLAIVGAMVAIIIILAFVLKPKRAPKISPKERAMSRIQRTRARSADMAEKLFALEISQAVRDYIEDRHNLPAPERTTQEFLKIAALTFDESSSKILEAILNLSDMAKFARHSFKDNEREELAKLAEQFIEEDDAKLSQNEKKIDAPSIDAEQAERKESTSK